MNLREIKIIPIFESVRAIDISDNEYFGPNYKKYISNSSLSLINPAQGGSPQIYYEGLSAHQKFSDSLVFGSAVHCLTLQPDDFVLVESVNRPTAKAGLMADELFPIFCERGKIEFEDIVKASDKIDYYKGKMDDKKASTLLEKCNDYFWSRKRYEKEESLFTGPSKEPIYLDDKSRDKLRKCLESIQNNQDIQKILHPEGIISNPESNNEICILLDVKAIYPDGNERILSLKAKVDNYTLDEESNKLIVNDLKTTGHDVSEFQNSFYKFHYYRQMAMYGWMLRILLSKDESISMKSNMLLISTIPPFNSGVFKVLNTHISRGMSEFSELLKRVAYHEQYGYDIEEPKL